jgi:hypothetical protein
MEAPFAGLAVVEKKPISAGYSIVVKVVNDRDLEFESGLINGGRQARENVVDLPKIEIANLLVASQSLSNGEVVESAEGGLNFIHDIFPEQLISRADEVLGIVILLESIADAENRTFLAAEVNIAAEDLENAEAAHTPHSMRRGSDGKEGRSGCAAILNVECLIFSRVCGPDAGPDRFGAGRGRDAES